ncbi:Rieske (2Fe-2S) protein [Terrabacter ginsenosidimutans]|uniref:Cytochrome bc1 complex Rieske iron-sulfur subunit n=1 Tax=Terrabacter ginsenosidimutans TaxID=490575 RepID=A0ABP7DWH6_9MICO
MTEGTHSGATEPTGNTSISTHALDHGTDHGPDHGPDHGLSERVAVLTDRRGVLKLAGVVVGAGALAACSSPPVPTSSDAASPSGDSAGAASGAASGGIPTSEIPVGGGKIFADTRTVVTQPTAGSFKAFDSTCTHQGCPVTSIVGQQIVCPCHGSAFDVATGDVVNGPATSPLAPKKVTVTGSTLTVS